MAAATGWLAVAGIETARVDAELLLAHVLGVPRGALVTAAAPNAAALERYNDVLVRRAAREPLQYIVGTAPFRHIEVAVGPGVFIPRPETELLVDAVLPVLRSAEAPVAVDLCSGSGALALAVVNEVPAARVYAVEQEGSAVPWLRRNAAGSRVEVVVADVTEPGLLPELHGAADAVMGNPPYVPTTVEVANEVRHEPYGALFAGSDGLGVFPAVIARAAELLRPGGVLAMEHDYTHADAVSELLDRDGRWRDIADHDDLTGRPRFATAVRA